MLYFITGNAGKFRETQAIIAELAQLELDVDELQSLNPQTVINHKLDQAAALHDGSFIVEDTSLVFTCLSGLPGTMIKWFVETLGNTGMSELVARYPDHTAMSRCTIGYRDTAGQHHFFTGELAGTIVSPRGNVSEFGWNSIFEVAGTNRTFAEMTVAEKNQISARGIATRQLADFLAAKQTDRNPAR
jgi:inosine triphosphate pyrophosphatase